MRSVRNPYTSVAQLRAAVVCRFTSGSSTTSQHDSYSPIVSCFRCLAQSAWLFQRCPWYLQRTASSKSCLLTPRSAKLHCKRLPARVPSVATTHIMFPFPCGILHQGWGPASSKTSRGLHITLICMSDRLACMGLGNHTCLSSEISATCAVHYTNSIS